MTERPHTPPDADEKATLSAFLDQQRWDVADRITGLTDEQLRRAVVPSGWSLLGLISHLTDVEVSWFQDRFAGRDLAGSTDDGEAAGFTVGPEDTAATVVAAYDPAVAEGRRIVAAASLDTPAARAPRGHTLRWILVHLVEETARHNGQADVVRELIDGRTGNA